MMAESQHVEWKQAWRDEYLRWVCGFANAQGGKLVIGKNKRGQSVGVTNARKLLEDLPNKIRDLLGIVAEVNLVSDGDKDLVEIRVAPHSNSISYRGKYYVRSGSTLQELKGAGLDHFLLRREGRTWDGTPMPQLSPRDLSQPAIDRFRKLAVKSGRLDETALTETVSGLLEKLLLFDGRYPKRAVALLFHDEPERFVTGAFVKIGYFDSASELVYHDLVEGDLFSQVRQTIDLVRAKYLKAVISYEGIQRIETFPVPQAALREVILNALIHKNYASNVPVQIRVYTDKLKIWNSATLPQGWTMEKLLSEHSSQPFNPIIANAFFRAGEIEAWGQGIQRIFSACRAAGFPEPLIRYEANELWVEFPFSPVYLEAISVKDNGLRTTRKTPGKHPENTRKTPRKYPENAQKTPRKYPENTQKKTTRGLRKSPGRKILEVLRKHPSASRREIAQMLGDVTENSVKYHLDKLKAAGHVTRVGADRGGHWEVNVPEDFLP